MFWTRSPRNFPSRVFSSLAFSLSLCVCFSSWENNAAAACFLRLFLIRLWWTVIGWNEKPKAFFISRCRPLLEFTLFLNISELKFKKKRNPEEMPTVSCGFTFYICFQPYRILEPSSRPPLEISSPYLLISGHEIHLLVCLSTEEKKKEKPRNFSEPDLQTDWRGAERWSDTVWLPLNAEHVSTVLDWQRALDALPLCTAPQVSELCRVWAKVCVMVWESFHVFFVFFFACAHVWVFWVLERPECWVSVRVDQSLPFCSFPAFGWVSVHSVQAAFMECCWASRWPVPARLWLCWMSVIGR